MGVVVRGADRAPSTYVRNFRTTLPKLWPYFPEVSTTSSTRSPRSISPLTSFLNRVSFVRANRTSSASPSAAARRSASLALTILQVARLLNPVLSFSSSSHSTRRPPQGARARKIDDVDERERAFHGPQERVSEPDLVRCVRYKSGDCPRW
jgi:hypothetical protein